MHFQVLNFSKYNPRGDVKNPSWVRLERSWWVDMWGWSPDAQRAWFMLLGLVTDFETGYGDVDPDFIAANLKITTSRVWDALRFLIEKKRIAIETIASVTSPSRGRDADDTAAGVTNGTDETYETGRTGNAGGPPDPPTCPETLPAVVTPKKPAKGPKPVPDGTRVWMAYHQAYVARYGQVPVRNAKANGQCAQLVARLGAEAAVKVVQFYLTHGGRWYVQTVHALGACLKDAEALHTQMLAGHRVSAAEADHRDKQLGNAQAFATAAAILAAEQETHGAS